MQREVALTGSILTVAALRNWRGTIAIVVVWLAVRLVMTLFVEPVIGGDQTGYVSAAQEFMTSGGAVVARRSPAYMAFLAATMWLGPHGVYTLQSLMTLGAALLTKRLMGFWQGLAIAACPFFVIWEWALLTETLCWTALWCGWLLIFWKRPPATSIGVVLLGVAVLTRPILLLLPAAAAAVLLLRGAKRRAIAVLAGIYVPAAAVLSIAVGPTLLGANTWIGTWERSPEWIERSATQWPKEAHMSPSEQAKLPLLPEARDDSLFIDAAAQRYKEAPLEAFGTWFARYPYLWIGTRTAFVRPAPKTGGWFAYKASMWLLNLGMLLLGCAGGLIAMRRRDRDRVLLVPIAYVALIYLPFHSTEPRYSLVALPFLLALAVYAALQITGARQQT